MNRILIIEDDEFIAEVTTFSLMQAGYEAYNVLHADQIFTLIDQLKPDLLIVDNYIGKIEGRSLIKVLMNNAFTRIIPILMISAAEDIRKSALEAGANAFLSKPFDLVDLIREVGNLLPLQEKNLVNE